MLPSDLEDVLRLQRESSLTEWSRGDYDGLLMSKSSVAIVSYKFPDSFCGFAVAHIIDSDRIAEILNIAVNEAERRTGIGKCLLDEIFRVCSSRADRVHLEVRESNRSAIDFYHSCDFREAGRRRNYYSNPIEDAILMTRKIEYDRAPIGTLK